MPCATTLWLHGSLLAEVDAAEQPGSLHIQPISGQHNVVMCDMY